MSSTLHVRFLQPIDPRAVFDLAAGLVELPDGEFTHQAPGSRPNYEGDWWPLNPRLKSNAGTTDAGIVTVDYGNEASPVIQEWDISEFPEEYSAEQRGPLPGYVELDITCSGGCTPAWYDRDDYRFMQFWEVAIIKWAGVRGVPIAISNDGGTWKQ